MYLSLILASLYLLLEYVLSQYVFEPLNLYYELPWLDIPMHLLGGFGVAWFFIALLSVLKRSYTMRVVLLLTLVVAISWEIFERLLDLFAIREWGGWLDTLTDLLNGIIGALAAYKVFSK